MREIGGFLELELNRGRAYHSGALALNLGRTALEYILISRKVKRISIPYFSCDAIAGAAQRAGTDVIRYHLDENLDPVIENESQNEYDYFLYINYFGIKAKTVKKLTGRIHNLIIDNSQAFFDMPFPGIDTFYSARKFFGVPDGGYLYTDVPPWTDLPADNSSGRFIHLIGRIENGPENSYPYFKENEIALSLEPLKKMSVISDRLLRNIDYEAVRKNRIRNFNLLQEALGSRNMLGTESTGEQVPMVYPFQTENSHLQHILRDKKIYTPVYWPDVLQTVSSDSVEHSFVTGIVPLPVDQRYSDAEMKYVAKTVLNHA